MASLFANNQSSESESFTTTLHQLSLHYNTGKAQRTPTLTLPFMVSSNASDNILLQKSIAYPRNLFANTEFFRCVNPDVADRIVHFAIFRYSKISATMLTLHTFFDIAKQGGIMKLQFKSREVLILLAASVMSFLANLPDSILGNLVDRRWLLGALAALVVVAMFRYLQTILLLTICILAIGANIPEELAAALGISQLALIVSLAVLVTITLLNRVVKLLPTEREAPSTEISSWRQTMMAAIAEGDQATLLCLLAMNKNVNFLHDGNTPIHLAAEKGHTDIMRMLISHGADFRVKNSAGKTPLEIAMEKKNRVPTKDIPHEIKRQSLTTSRQVETKRADAELWQNQHGT